MRSRDQRPGVKVPRVVLICGGLGGARIAPHLAARSHLTVIANVADDLDIIGLRVCPDIDAVVYALAGVFDHERGYAIRGDSFSFLDLARRAGAPAWFAIGDRDLHTHVLRTALLEDGIGLSDTTRRLTRALAPGVSAVVLPATETTVHTRVSTIDGELSFQEFFVDGRAQARPTGVRYERSQSAVPGPGVLNAIQEAQLIVIAESSPVASILPTLDLPGMRSALRDTSACRVALAPMVMSTPPTTPVDIRHWRAREALMRAAGLPHRPEEVARLYTGLIDVFVMHGADREFEPPSVKTVYQDLVDRSGPARISLVEALLTL